MVLTALAFTYNNDTVLVCGACLGYASRRRIAPSFADFVGRTSPCPPPPPPPPQVLNVFKINGLQALFYTRHYTTCQALLPNAKPFIHSPSGTNAADGSVSYFRFIYGIFSSIPAFSQIRLHSPASAPIMRWGGFGNVNRRPKRRDAYDPWSYKGAISTWEGKKRDGGLPCSNSGRLRPSTRDTLERLGLVAPPKGSGKPRSRGVWLGRGLFKYCAILVPNIMF